MGGAGQGGWGGVGTARGGGLREEDDCERGKRSNPSGPSPQNRKFSLNSLTVDWARAKRCAPLAKHRACDGEKARDGPEKGSKLPAMSFFSSARWHSLPRGQINSR